ncbi:EF-hand calcium-binding domain-containing protein 13-like [Petaurus breviceps papuanus]|uniref:EF-hand calcium-binding domain-containing protein 13-like n=1 Tax=Petaurus breviceps papuanus TaxID=3040969 RepID=UPI0036D9DA99
MAIKRQNFNYSTSVATRGKPNEPTKGKVNLKNIMNAMQNLRGGNVNINNLDKVLGNLGIKLTDKEIEELLCNLPVDAYGQVALNDIMDNVKSIKENISVQNLDNFLKDMGIKLTEDESHDLLKRLPINAQGKINKNALMNAMKRFRGGNIDINNLDKILGNLGIKLTDREMEELVSKLPIDDDGTVALNKLMENVKTVKENIDPQNLDNFLKDMGITLSEDERQDLLKHLPIDGKINKKNIMDVVQNFRGGNVNINNLDNVLGNLGIKLTDREMEELLNNLPVDANGKVSLKKVMDNVKSIKENIDAQNLDNFLKDMGITLTEDEQQDLLRRLPIDANGKVKMKNLMNAVQNLKRGTVDINNLDQILGNLGIKLTDGEIEELMSNMAADANGRVELNKLLDDMKYIKENIDAQNLDNFLKEMGITLTEDEHQDLLRCLPIDAKGKINKKNIMDSVKNLHGCELFGGRDSASEGSKVAQ